MKEENYTAYDLEPEAPLPEGTPKIPGRHATEAEPDAKEKETPEPQANPDPEKEEPSPEENPDPAAEKEETKPKENPDSAREELEKMIADMGAAKLLEIIRGNRNAAITQIMEEIEEQTPRSLQSGTSVATRSHSIFDLASLA